MKRVRPWLLPFLHLSLFNLAEDLTKMELHVAVDEADIGQVREGQEATFTVDAYPERKFSAVIRSGAFRLNRHRRGGDL